MPFDKKAVGNYIRVLQQTLTEAGLNYSVCRIYTSGEARAKYEEVFHRYELFFWTSGEAHFAITFVALCRLYETRSDTHNIKNLLTEIKGSQLLDSVSMNELDKNYAEAKPFLKKIHCIRSNVYGHRSNKRSVPEWFAEASLRHSDIDALIKFSENLLNEISNKCLGMTHSFKFDSGPTLARLLDDIFEYHLEKKKTGLAKHGITVEEAGSLLSIK